MAKLVDINGLTYFWSKIKTKFISGVKVNGTTITPASDMTVDIPLASTSGAGVMSSQDKTKLNGVATGAQVNVIESVKVNGTALTVTSKAVDIPLATTSSAGVMSASDKTKVNNSITNIIVNGINGTVTGGISSVNVGSSDINLSTDIVIDSETTSNVQDAISSLNTYASNLAPKENPAFTGTPTAPTATSGTNTTQIATTAFVQSTVSSAISGITDVYTYKGSKATYAQLPSSGNTIGDVWNVEAEYTDSTTQKIYPAGTNWAWDGSSWDALGGEIILVTNSEIDTIVAS